MTENPWCPIANPHMHKTWNDGWNKAIETAHQSVFVNLPDNVRFTKSFDIILGGIKTLRKKVSE